MKEDDLILKKVKYYFSKKKKVHIRLKIGEFRNGEIKEISSEFFTLKERLGDLVIFFMEVKDVMPLISKNDL